MKGSNIERGMVGQSGRPRTGGRPSTGRPENDVGQGGGQESQFLVGRL